MATVRGPHSWSLKRDEEGQREYAVTFLVEVAYGEGPAAASNAPGLPLIGDTWAINSDVDVFAWCHPEAEVEPTSNQDRDPTRFFDVKYKFSTKPLKKCKDQEVENPLLEPMEVSGQTKEFNREFTHDRFSDPILNSAWEQMKGPQVEWAEAKPVIKVKQNVLNLELELLEALVNCVNDGFMWGLPDRCILFSNYSWEKKFHGFCSVYYTRTLEFTVATLITVEAGVDDDGNAFVESTLESAHDRWALDEGTKVLNGRWDKVTGDWVLVNIRGEPPDPNNPKHFIRFKDRNNENTHVILNGNGEPARVGIRVHDPGTGTGSTVDEADDPGRFHIQAYRSANLFLLGIPLTL